jgi:hypothetical protein
MHALLDAAGLWLTAPRERAYEVGVIMAAAEALAQGVDTPSLRELAGISTDRISSWSLTVFARAAFEELGLNLPEPRSAEAQTDSLGTRTWPPTQFFQNSDPPHRTKDVSEWLCGWRAPTGLAASSGPLQNVAAHVVRKQAGHGGDLAHLDRGRIETGQYAMKPWEVAAVDQLTPPFQVALVRLTCHPIPETVQVPVNCGLPLGPPPRGRPPARRPPAQPLRTPDRGTSTANSPRNSAAAPSNYAERFAGAGTYTGGEPGSPVIGFETLIRDRSLRVKALDLRFLFVERDRRRVARLREQLTIAARPVALEDLSRYGSDLAVEAGDYDPTLARSAFEARCVGSLHARRARHHWGASSWTSSGGSRPTRRARWSGRGDPVLLQAVRFVAAGFGGRPGRRQPRRPLSRPRYWVGIDGSVVELAEWRVGDAVMMWVRPEVAGRQLDGRLWDDYPAEAAPLKAVRSDAAAFSNRAGGRPRRGSRGHGRAQRPVLPGGCAGLR